MSKIFQCSKTFEHNRFENELSSFHNMHVDRDCNVGHIIADFVTAVFSLFWNVNKGRVLVFAKALLIPEHVFPFCLYIVPSVQCLEEEKKRGGEGRRDPIVEDAELSTDINFSIRIQELPRIARPTSVPLRSFSMFKISVAFLMN